MEASRENFDAYILHTHGAKKDAIVEGIRQSVSIFNGGENKKARIDTLKKYIQSKSITLIDGTRIEIEDSPDIQKDCGQMPKPVFVFNDNGKNLFLTQGQKVEQFELKGKEALITMVTVDADGRVDREALLALEKRDAILRPKACVQTDDARMFIHAERKKEYRFGTITFQ